MATTVDKTSHQNIAFIKKTGTNRNSAAIFAHGKRCPGDFSVQGKNITLNFYVRDEAKFNFVHSPNNDCFSLLKANRLLPYEIYNTASTARVPNYQLNKAAGRHIHPVEARIQYTEMESIVDDPAANFDVISVRYKKIHFSQQTLETVVNAGMAKGYNNFHLFFCRAKNNGDDTHGVKAPQVIQAGVSTLIRS